MKTVRVACWIWLACAFAACSGDKKLELGGTCTLNSDCTSPLLCKLGSCRKACVRSVDCENGGRCVTVDGVAVCQTQAESACGADQTCATGLVCRTVDNTCRTPCSPTNDTSCVAGQTCNGTVCLENKELAISGNDAAVGADDAATSPDAGATGPDLSLTPPDAASPDVPLAPSDAASADVPLAKPDAAADAPASSSDSGAAGDTVGGANPDTSPSTVCIPACTAGQECVAGTCEPCARLGQACCAGTCNANLTCNTANNQCACGNQDQACCDGKTCSAELACVGGKCTSGEFGYACSAGKTCNNGGVCAGTRCTCLKSCDLGWYKKTDGTIGRSDDLTYQLKGADGTVFADPDAQITGTDPNYTTVICVVPKDGSVWCAGSNANGGLGTGDSALTSSSQLVRVVTGVGGSPLAGIRKISAQGNTASPTVCALSEVGEIWCWGTGSNGQLGTGFLAGSSFAVPVVTSPGGPRFADAIEVSVGAESTCAIKKGGTLWCWGRNNYGQLGTGDNKDSAIPVQVSNLAGQEITSIYTSGPRACASTRDGYVWCWGYNSNGVLGPDGPAAGSNVPIRLVMTKGGAAFQDAVSVVVGRALKRDGSAWEWYDVTEPRPLVRNGVAVTSPYYWGRWCWIGADGKMFYTSTSSTNVTCP